MIKSQPLKWHGGKSYLAKWLHSLAPPSVVDDTENGYTHRNIVCGGGLGEFWNWQPVEGISETANDINADLTNFWNVLKYEYTCEVFQRLINAMPFSQQTWETNTRVLPDNSSNCIDAAIRFFVQYRQSRQGLGKDYATPTTRTRRGMNENVSAWLSAVDGLPECHERLRRVEIRNLPAIEFIEAYDHPRALFYLDPPYLAETRRSNGEYGPYEMTAEWHQALLDCLAQIDGQFMLSGYQSAMYDRQAKAARWFCHERQIDNKASSSKTKQVKTECVWTNYSPF